MEYTHVPFQRQLHGLLLTEASRCGRPPAIERKMALRQDGMPERHALECSTCNQQSPR